MKNMIDKIFNWKKHPASVWYVALPLFVLGCLFHLTKAAYLDVDGRYWLIAGECVIILAVTLLVRKSWSSYNNLLAATYANSQKGKSYGN